MGTCRFCLCDRHLVKAHVIPAAFFTLPEPDQDAAKILSLSKDHHPKITRKGVYDETILCGDCDGKLGLLDQHAAEQLLQKGATKEVQQEKSKLRVYGGADPDKMKAFIASVAWRASISCHYFFRTVRLGPYEDKIRDALLGENDYEGVETILSEFTRRTAPC